ncbi:uncharacterized protein B0P05DRAFT_552576 [Gilbertella persicaria]|uniref:uncharacterized protein n=1 Tax=Gilbertella persicaria TaxID=101096 RepID=UPI00221F9F74|nr:uncharacterized protein B0P05DRAFT_552576 [Gilbertella persicaria]KAI8067692.1 hypothetical protein B0P05DRAFT_552576 [Gilbertella persicaria]
MFDRWCRSTLDRWCRWCWYDSLWIGWYRVGMFGLLDKFRFRLGYIETSGRFLYCLFSDWFLDHGCCGRNSVTQIMKCTGIVIIVRCFCIGFVMDINSYPSIIQDKFKNTRFNAFQDKRLLSSQFINSFCIKL